MTATAPINRQMQPVEWILLLILSLVWAGSFLFNGIAVRELPVFTIVVGRVAIAAMILLLVLRWRGESLPRDPAVWRAFLVMGFLNNVLPFSLIVWGQGHISSGQASILNAMTPIFTVIMVHLLTRDEKMTPGRIGGILVGFAGVAVMLGAEIRAGSGITLAAQCALLGATICYAVAVVFGRRFRSIVMSPMMTATGQAAMASLILLPAWLLIDRPWSLPMPGPAAIMAVLAIASLSTAFAYALYFRVLSTAGATNASLVTMLIPPGAIIMGILVLDETVLPRHLVGLALIIAGPLVTDGRIRPPRRG